MLACGGPHHQHASNEEPSMKLHVPHGQDADDCYKSVITALIDANADASATSAIKRLTALHFAAESGGEFIVQTLFNHAFQGGSPDNATVGESNSDKLSSRAQQG